MKIKKGDNVRIIAGKDRGKSGKVLKTLIKRGRILVEGVNLYKKHVRPKRQGETGETVSLPKSLAVSNILLICPGCKRPTRIGYREEGTEKRRYCKQCLNLF